LEKNITQNAESNCEISKQNNQSIVWGKQYYNAALNEIPIIGNPCEPNSV
jgi:hypothetical protein